MPKSVPNPAHLSQSDLPGACVKRVRILFRCSPRRAGVDGPNVDRPAYNREIVTPHGLCSILSMQTHDGLPRANNHASVLEPRSAGGGGGGVERCEMRGTNMFPVGKLAASEACKSHHRPCAASYRVQSTLDEGPGGRKGSWLAAAKAELGGKESKDIFPKLGTKTVRRISFPPPCRGGGTNRERSVAGGGWWARWVVAPGHVLLSVLSVLSVLSCTVAVDTSNLAIAVSPFLGPRPSRRNLGVRRLDLNSAGPKLARLEEERRRRSRARVLHTMANCRPGGAPSVVGDGAVFEVFFGGEDARTNRWLFHFGCARKMDRLGQPSRASVMDDRHGHGSSVREKRSRGAPVSSNQRVAWQRPGPIANVGARQRRQEWGNRASCFEMTGRGRLRGRARRRMHTGRDAVGPGGRPAATPKLACCGCWRRGDDGGGVRRMGEEGGGRMGEENRALAGPRCEYPASVVEFSR